METLSAFSSVQFTQYSIEKVEFNTYDGSSIATNSEGDSIVGSTTLCLHNK